MPISGPKLVAPLIAIAIVLSASPARAQEADPAPLILVAGPDAVERMEQLASALDAYLSDLDVRISIITREELPASGPERATTARAAAEEHDALAVVWISDRPAELFLFLSRRGAEVVVVHDLPGAEASWDEQCDAIASMIRSGIVSWIGEASIASPEEPPEEPPPTESPLPAPPAEPDRERLRLMAAAGYALDVQNASGTALNGGALGLGVLVASHLEIGFSVRLIERARLDVDQVEIHLRRLPLRAHVGGCLSFGRFDTVLEAGVVIDVTRLTGDAASQAPDDTSRAFTGFSPGLGARFRITDWIAVHAAGGIDVFSTNYEYLWDNEPVLDYSAVQPWITVGLTALPQVL
jgi:hypothetical protein